MSYGFNNKSDLTLNDSAVLSDIVSSLPLRGFRPICSRRACRSRVPALFKALLKIDRLVEQLIPVFLLISIYDKSVKSLRAIIIALKG